MEAYKVWVTLNLKGDALQKMELFTKATQRATAAVGKLQMTMRPNVNMFDHMAVNLREINPQLNAMANNINKIDSASKRMSRSSKSGGMLGSFGMGLGLMNPYMAAGVGAGFLVKSGFHQGTEYDRSLAQLSAMGYSQNQLDFAKKFTSTAKPGISPVAQLDAFVSAQMATQSFDMAKTLSPIIAQNKMASQILYGGMTHKQTQDAIRTAEMIGGSNPKKVAEALTSVLQMTALSGGSIMPQEQRTFMRQAAGSASRLTNMGFLSLEPIMQEYGGAKTGTALTTGLRAFSNPQIANFPRYRVKRLEQLGLWDAKSNRMKSEYLDLLQTDPTQFAQVWLKQLSKHGVTKDSDILTETTSAFPRTFGTLMMLMIKNMDKITRERGLISNLPQDKRISGIAQDNQAGALYRFTQSWESLSKSINDLTKPGVITGLNLISSIFENIANAINSIPSFKNTNSKIFGLTGGPARLSSIFSGSNVTAGATKSDANTTVHVNVDGKELAKATVKNIPNATLGHQIAHHGVSNINPLSPYPNAVSQGVM